ncbi:hypothetical protein HY745_11720 [Candidatus Desantisbacteria bacterium]|nr:hypothetical protein [Candidatus Desantisbacteria bacterium]
MDKIKMELNKILSRGLEMEHAVSIQYMVDAGVTQKELLSFLKNRLEKGKTPMKNPVNHRDNFFLRKELT